MRAGVFWILAALVAGTSAADFAGVEGFSGRVADCTSCHVPSPIAPAATVTLDGLPDAWQPETSYALTVTVHGGPPALPAPQPQGGFELESSAGHLTVPPEMEGLLRSAAPTVMTYTPDGTLRRSWNITWIAPNLDAAPDTVGFWVAAIAANGNHIIAGGASDAGEHGDQTAVATATVPVHEDAHAAWLALPLAPPVVLDKPGTLLEGRHADDNATHLAWRFVGQDWLRRPTGTAWRLHLEGGHDGTLELRSEGMGRTSPSVLVTRTDGASTIHEGAPAPQRDAPLPLWPALSLLFLARRRP